MNLQPLDPERRLWQVDEFLPEELAEQFYRADWLSANSTQSVEQPDLWPRSQIEWNDPLAQSLGQIINSQLPEINRQLNTNFTRSGGHFWIDHPGFQCPIHTDGHLANSMQLYWIVPNEDYGTSFYYYRDLNTLKYQFLSRPNTGYIMLNHLNEDGSQPLQWHAMTRRVPPNTIRISSYWQFE